MSAFDPRTVVDISGTAIELILSENYVYQLTTTVIDSDFDWNEINLRLLG